MVAVSIIMLIYNITDALGKAIQSKLNQIYKHFEVTLFNDGSTDSSGHVCNEFQKKDSRTSNSLRKFWSLICSKC